MRIEVISEILLHKIANAKKDACLVRERWNRIKRIHEDAVRENVMEKEYRRKRVYKKSCKGSHINFIYIQLVDRHQHHTMSEQDIWMNT